MHTYIIYGYVYVYMYIHMNVTILKNKNNELFISELCSSENIPEVEIFSLLEEQIPKYKVRSDFLTDFSGYSNQDWFVPAPALEIPTEGLGLTKEQTRETLNYFRKYILQLITYLYK